MRVVSGAAISFPFPPLPRHRQPPLSEIHSFRSSARLSIRARAQLPRSSPLPSMAMEPQSESMKLLFVEMGVGYDQHGQDITAAAMRACKDAISSNSIPAFRRGSIPGVNADQMKLQIKLGIPRSAQTFLDAERVKSVFPYGKIISFEVVDGGMICSSGVCLEAMGDKSDDCYIVNAAVKLYDDLPIIKNDLVVHSDSKDLFRKEYHLHDRECPFYCPEANALTDDWFANTH